MMGPWDIVEKRWREKQPAEHRARVEAVGLQVAAVAGVVAFVTMMIVIPLLLFGGQ